MSKHSRIHDRLFRACAVGFLFQGCGSFEPRGLPRLCVGADDWLAANVCGSAKVASRASTREVYRTFGTFNFAGVFATRIWDLVTRARSVKSFGMLWAMLWRFNTHCTSVLDWVVRGSKWDKVGVVHDNSRCSSETLTFLSFPKEGRLSHKQSDKVTICKTSCKQIACQRFYVTNNRRRIISDIDSHPSLRAYFCT